MNAPLLGNDPLDLKIILEDASGAPITDVAGLEFTMNPPAGFNFSAPSVVDCASDGWMGNITFSPSDLLGTSGTGTDPITVTVAKPFGTSSTGSGQICGLMCIATIDEVLGIGGFDGGCPQLTLAFTDVSYQRLLISSEGPTLVTEELEDATVVVDFCGQCEITDLQTAVTCSPSLDNYMVDVSFTGEAGETYTITDGIGSMSYTGSTGTYSFGPYNSDAYGTISVIGTDSLTICSTTFYENCESPVAPPSCSDNIFDPGELDIDCGGPDCPPCLDCGMVVEATSICYDIDSFYVAVDIQNVEAWYTLLDDQGNPPVLTNEEYFVLGPYLRGVTVNVVIDALTLAGDCEWSISATYAGCPSFDFLPPNAVCGASGFDLFYGLNGPYANYSSGSDGGVPIPEEICFLDELTNVVWYTFEGTGDDVNISATRCDVPLADYENDLQMLVFENCGDAYALVCSEDALNYQPSVFLATEEMQTYHIMIDGYGSYDPTGEYCISVCNAPVCGDADIEKVSCPSANDGSIMLSPSGGSGSYQYKWSTGATTQNISALALGTYHVTVTDNEGCPCLQSFEVELADDALDLSVTPTVEGVTGGLSPFYYNVVEIEVEGGIPPFDYNWDNLGYVRSSVISSDGDVRIIYSSDAQWSVTVTDANGCEVFVGNDGSGSSSDVLLNIVDYSLTPNTPGVSPSGMISVIVDGGTPPYAYSWNTGATTSFLTGLSDGWYNVTVTDSSTPPQEDTGWYWMYTSVPGSRGKTDLEATSFFASPNPLTEQSVIHYQSSIDDSLLQIDLMSIDGQLIAPLFSSPVEAGQEHFMAIDQTLTSQLSNGIYLCVARHSTGQSDYIKLVVAK